MLYYQQENDTLLILFKCLSTAIFQLTKFANVKLHLNTTKTENYICLKKIVKLSDKRKQDDENISCQHFMTVFDTQLSRHSCQLKKMLIFDIETHKQQYFLSVGLQTHTYL